MVPLYSWVTGYVSCPCFSWSSLTVKIKYIKTIYAVVCFSEAGCFLDSDIFFNTFHMLSKGNDYGLVFKGLRFICTSDFRHSCSLGLLISFGISLKKKSPICQAVLPCEDLTVAIRCDHLQCKLPLGKVIYMHCSHLLVVQPFLSVLTILKLLRGPGSVWGVISGSHMCLYSLPSERLAVAMLNGTATSRSLPQWLGGNGPWRAHALTCLIVFEMTEEPRDTCLH